MANFCLIFYALAVSFISLGRAQSPLGSAQKNPTERQAEKFVAEAEKELEKAAIKATKLYWAYATNITDFNEKNQLDYQKITDGISLKLGKRALKFDLDSIGDPVMKRKLKFMSSIGTSILEGDDLDRYNKITNDMQKIYSTAKVPDFNDRKRMVSLEPEITLAMAESRNPDELKYYWTEWRKVTGAKFRNLFTEYIDLTNKAARKNGLRDGTEMKLLGYESDSFEQEMDATWSGLKPLYEQLHAYVRHRLRAKYGPSLVKNNGLIPAHLLGNMWAQSWNNLEDMMTPYPEKPSISVTKAMKDQGWTTKKMFEKADEFFQSLGLEPMNKGFWKNSVLEKPTDGRDLVCHASAWDFQTGDDFRIKMCTRVNEEDFVTVNHEMGHVQYFMSYRNQSYLFRSGANPGFHEGVADILSLAVGTASYFQRLGLLTSDIDLADKETNINILMSMALQRLAFMPFGYLVDKYRWDLFSGWASKDDLNCHWVRLRAEIQGVAPPDKRNDEDQFDAGAKYHVAANVGYIRYFTAFVYEFQFYKALCLLSGQYDPQDPYKPLHRCNFYGSKEVGEKLVEMLSLGSSKPWKEAMKVMTGQPEMDTSAFRDYFRPLEKWLTEENKKNGVKVGWKTPPMEDMCKSKPTTSDASNNEHTNFILTNCLISIFIIFAVI